MRYLHRLYALSLVALVGFFLPPAALAQETQETRTLEPGKALEGELAGGQTHSYRISLAADQYLHLVVEQRGIDVVVTVLGPDGKKLAEVDSPNGTQGPEPVLLVAGVSGDYRFEVRSLQKDAAAGRYEAKIAELRVATSQDMDRLAAERAFAEAERLRRKGTAESLRGAIEKYEEALPLWRAVGNGLKEATTLHVMGRVYNSLGERQKGLAYLDQALPVWRAVGDRSGEASALHNIGGIYNSLGEWQKALDYYNQALPLWRAVGGRAGEAGTVNNIGTSYNLATTIGLARAGEATTLNNMGVIYDSLGEWQKSLDYYNQALPLWRAVRDRTGEAFTLSNIGTVYHSLGETQKALDYFNQALPLDRTLKNRPGEAGTLRNIGMIYHSLGEWQKALDYLNQALLLYRTIGARPGEATTLNNIGTVYHSMGETQKALDYFNQALPQHRAVGARAGEAGTLRNIGALYHSMGETQKALDYLKQSLPIWRAVGDRAGEASALYRLALAEQGRGNLSEARASMEEALKLVEFIRTNVVAQELRASFLASKQEYYKSYINLLMRLDRRDPGQGFNTLALQANERARARSLLETLTEARADIRQGVDAALLDAERRLQQQLNAKAQARMQLLARKHTPEQAAAVDHELRALTTQYHELQAQIRTSSPRYAALTQPQPLSLSELQQVLDPDTLLLEYALGEERSYLWAVSQDSVASFELPKRTEVEAAARSFYEALVAFNQPSRTTTANTPQPTVAAANPLAAGTALSQMLLSPVAAQLGNKRLLIVAEGALQYVPFAALPVVRSQSSVAKGPTRNNGQRTTDNGQPLIVNHEIISLPSASSLAVLRRELAGRKAATKALAVFADPVFSADDARLRQVQAGIKTEPQVAATNETRDLEQPLTRSAREAGVSEADLRIPRLRKTRAEANAIAALVPAAERKQALDFEANRATATSEELSQYRIVHFATHGLLNSTHPELSGIVLSLVDREGKSQDGFLRMHEIYNLKLPAELVVLSACQTGLGREIKGEGLVGLTRGFMYAGAARVLASLWKVDDIATAELMKHFYESMMKDGLRPAAALRAAQIQMWKQPRWQEPYYWAAFVLQGEWK